MSIIKHCQTLQLFISNLPKATITRPLVDKFTAATDAVVLYCNTSATFVEYRHPLIHFKELLLNKLRFAEQKKQAEIQLTDEDIRVARAVDIICNQIKIFAKQKLPAAKGKPGRRGYPVEVWNHAKKLREENPSMKVITIRKQCLEKFSEEDVPPTVDAFRTFMNRQRTN